MTVASPVHFPLHLYLCRSDGYVALGEGPSDARGVPSTPCPRHNGAPQWAEAGMLPALGPEQAFNPNAVNFEDPHVQALLRRICTLRLAQFNDHERYLDMNRRYDLLLEYVAPSLPCPWCRAHAGKPCRTRRARLPFAQRWQRFHKQRLDRAKVAARLPGWA